MNIKLSSADQLAVDFVLDRAARLGTTSGNTAEATQGVPAESSVSHPAADPKRIESVEKLLKHLEHLPAPAPAADLLERTLLRIGTHSRGQAAVVPSEDRRNTQIQ